MKVMILTPNLPSKIILIATGGHVICAGIGMSSVSNFLGEIDLIFTISKAHLMAGEVRHHRADCVGGYEAKPRQSSATSPPLTVTHAAVSK